MKCILIHRPGLRGTLVRIRRGLQLKTHEYLRTHWDSSQREWSRPLYPRSCLIALSPHSDLCHLLALFSLLLFFSKSPVSWIFLLWFLGAQKPWREMKGWALVFSLLTLPWPASRLPVCAGDWDAGDDAAAGSSFALITPREPTIVWFGFLQPGRIFHISDVNGPLKPSPLHFWSNLHHMPLKGDEPTGRRASL